jgi:hypothetical protein
MFPSANRRRGEEHSPAEERGEEPDPKPAKEASEQVLVADWKSMEAT